MYGDTISKEKIAMQSFEEEFGPVDLWVTHPTLQQAGIDVVYGGELVDIKTQIGEDYGLKPFDFEDAYMAREHAAGHTLPFTDVGIILELSQKRVKDPDFIRTFTDKKLTTTLAFFIKDAVHTPRWIWIPYNSVVEYIDSMAWAGKYRVQTSVNGTGRFIKVNPHEFVHAQYHSCTGTI